MSRFADKATVRAETGNQVIMQTVGGKALADVGYAKSISAGKVMAFGVTTAVTRRRLIWKRHRWSAWDELSFEV
jgi:hypothetical protein